MMVLSRIRDVIEEGRRDRATLVHRLTELIPSVVCAFCELDLPTRQILSYQDSLGEVEQDSKDHPYWRLQHQYPTCVYLKTGRLDVVQISDFLPLREFRGRQIYSEMFQPEGIENVLSVPLPTAPGRTRVYLFGREPGSTFTETERDLMTLLQPHLYQLYKQAAGTRVRLTQRQLDVVRCVAIGMTNDEIAAQLSISGGTVAKHLENAYARLGVTTRTGAVARVLEAQAL